MARPILAAQPIAAAENPAVVVVHVTARAIYLEGGSDQGIQPGAKLEVWNQGQSIALLEVVSVTGHSTYCRLIHSFRPVTLGDTALLSSIDEVTVTGESEPLPPPPIPTNLPKRIDRERLSSMVRVQKISGSAYMRQQTRSSDVSTGTRTWTDSTARLSLRGRNLGGMPVSLRIRGRARTRSRSFDDQTDDNQRFYEASVTYEPEVGRSWWQAGRIGSRQETGVGLLDGFVGQWGLGPRWGVGGFAGLNPKVDDDLFGSSDTKAGAFVSFRTERGKTHYGEFLLSAVGEYVPGDLSREYVFVQTRLGKRGRWSVYQQTEVDLNRDWRQELSGSSYQLSNLSLSTTFKLSDRFRAAVSYDARRRFREYETRDIPEERFDELLREGVRATLFYRGEGGINVAFGVGVRGGEGDVADLNSYNFSVSHGDFLGRRIFVGFDATAFEGSESNGQLATVRARAAVTKKLDLGLTIGDSTSSTIFSDDDLYLGWVRLDLTRELPRGLFLIAEAEFGLRPASEDRQMMQLGYRF